MDIKILGTGCPKCNSLEKITRKAVDKSGIEAQIEKVEDIMEIMEYGIMRTPGLVINGEVKIAGRLPSEKEITELLTQ
ncbi:MAG: thioredoxin family protein [Bacteroidetes bacterium]|nr:MAG: thioredoxin family protein [Bacteroidota bacterium]RLD51687.1 MAG: thioredoxin family protein [Bacteroidota bacterium]RLD82658.1 MAG: thioredoxin family protein [Bacteroidota bacterium]